MCRFTDGHGRLGSAEAAHVAPGIVVAPGGVPHAAARTLPKSADSLASQSSAAGSLVYGGTRIRARHPVTKNLVVRPAPLRTPRWPLASIKLRHGRVHEMPARDGTGL